MTVNINDFRIVQVTWMDSCEMDAGWHTFDDIQNHTICKCMDVGWLIPTANSEQLLLMGSFSPKNVGDSEDLDQGGRVTTIPTAWVLDIVYLSEDKLEVN